MTISDQNALKLASVSRFKRFLSQSGSLILLFCLLFFLMPLGIFGLTYYETGFENFTAGKLEPQEGWECQYIDNCYVIENSENAYEGSKYVRKYGTYSDAYKPGLHHLKEGKVRFWFWIDSQALTNYSYGTINLLLKNATSTITNFSFQSADFSGDVWNRFEMEWKSNGGNYVDMIRYRYNYESFSEWENVSETPAYSFVDVIWFSSQWGQDYRIDNFKYGDVWTDIDLPEVYFDTPENNSDISVVPLNITGHFTGWNSDDFQTLQLTGCDFETGRCIVPKTTPITEFSGDFNFSISEELAIGTWKFYFNVIGGNWIYGTKNNEELSLNILVDFPEKDEPYLPVILEDTELKDPETYYSENSDYSTSTAIYGILSGTFGNALTWINNFLNLFDYFSLNKDEAGVLFGNSIRSGRSYLGNINAFFGDFPITHLLFLYLSCLLIIVVIKIVKFIRILLPF